jgi:hypothetical protein
MIDPIPYIYGRIIISLMTFSTKKAIFSDNIIPNDTIVRGYYRIETIYRIIVANCPKACSSDDIKVAIDILGKLKCFTVIVEPAAGDLINVRVKRLISVYKRERSRGRILELSSVDHYSTIEDSLNKIYETRLPNLDSRFPKKYEDVAPAFQGALGGRKRQVKFIYPRSDESRGRSDVKIRVGTTVYAAWIFGVLVFVASAFATGILQAIASVVVNYLTR